MAMHDDEGTLIAEMLTLTSLLDGKMQRYETLNSVGRSSKKIVIEYDIKAVSYTHLTLPTKRIV